MACRNLKRILLTLIVVGLIGNSDFSYGAESRLHFWIKSFIPNVHPVLSDYIQKTKKGTWVIKAPELPLNLGNLNGTCFVTDNRNFDSSETASARITVELVMVIDKISRRVSIEKYDGRDIVRIGGTHNVDCSTGIELNPPKTAPTSDVTVSDVKTNGFVKVIGITARASNPFYAFSPPITFDVILQYNLMSSNVEIKGDIGYFPSFEAYYTLNDSTVHKIFNFPPYKDSEAISLANLGSGVFLRNFGTTKILIP